VIEARAATGADLAAIAALYRELAAEMDALRPLWSEAEGLAAPLEDSLRVVLSGPPWWGYVGTLDGVLLGFLLARDEPLQPPCADTKVASIRFVFTVPQARQVGLGEAMITAFLHDAGARGITLFDAHVSPGHREAKNFFESNGFTARSITMHRGDRR